MDIIKKLSELKSLLDNGLLTQEEFDKIKADLISQQMDSSIVKNNDVAEVTKTHFKEEVIEKTVDRNEKDISDVEVDKSSEIDYIKNLEDVKTNHSYGRYILYMLLLIGFIGVTSYNFYFKDKWAKEEQSLKKNGNTRFTYLTEPVDDLESYSVTDIASEQELYAYLDEVAVFWCSEWKKAKEFKNENRRFEEMLKVDRCINAYPLGFQEGIIMLNDLPMALCSKAREHFQNKVIELGYEPNWNDENSEDIGSLEDEIKVYEKGNSSNFDEADYNRQQEQAEYESSQSKYNSLETKSESKKSNLKNNILDPGKILTYENGSISYTVEMDSEEKITITKFEPKKRAEGWGWMKRQCEYNSNSIKVTWIDDEYTIKKNELIVLSNGKINSFPLTNSN